VFKEFAVVLPLVFTFLPMVIPWAKSMEIISAEEDTAYNDGITGSHFAVGGIDRIIIPFQVSSFIADVLRLLTATFQVQRSLIWSWISVPLAKTIQLRAFWTWD
jgi:hypothetical protein